MCIRDSSGSVRTKTRKGWWVEVGTSDTPRHRMMRRAFDVAYSDMLTDLRKGV